MASNIIVVGILHPNDHIARDEIIGSISEIAAYADQKETNTRKYCICVPRDETLSTIFVMEEYVNKAAFDQHMGTDVVASVLDLFRSKPQLLAEEGSVIFTTVAAGMTRPTVSTADDPLVVFATLDYKPDTFDEALKGWKDIVADTEKTEPKTHMYNCLKDSETENRVRMLEAYENMAAFEAHCSTDILREKIVAEKSLIAKTPNVHFLKKVSGFLYKEQEPEMQRL